MSKAMNLYFTDKDRANIEVIRAKLAARGLKFTDQKGQDSTSALLRFLIDEKARELTIADYPLKIGG